jgi:PiT family inorganic phosphate transporter
VFSDGDPSLADAVRQASRTCVTHILDWFHVSMRIQHLRESCRSLVKVDEADQFEFRFAARELDQMRAKLWCGNVMMAQWLLCAAAGELLTSKGVVLTLKALVLSPLCGLVCGFLMMVLLLWMVRRSRPSSVNRNFRGLQLGSAGFMAFAHGSNDAQKSMGIITLALVAYAASQGQVRSLDVPVWVVFACATAMALGTASGGWRIMTTMGHKIIKLRPITGFAAETSAAVVIMVATWMKAPVSTTHVISSSIMGVGASKRVSAVRWGVAQNMLVAWVLTLPVSALVSAITYAALHCVFG